MDLPRVLLAAGLAGWLIVPAAAAKAYTIASAISDNCHEQITSEALRSVRGQLSTAGPLKANADERALINDLTFDAPSDLDDLAGVTLLLAVRDNDLKGRHAADLSQLALVHGDPDGQREHCLRQPDHQGPNGSRDAVEACRGFIRERFAQALDGLDEASQPDLGKRTELPVYLALRHRVKPKLPTFYVRIGQALHTIEDSFTHTYRSEDGMRITVVTNWIHEVEDKLDEEQDGPPHRGELDACKNLDDLRKQRKELATQAATETLHTALDPSLSRAQKMQALDALLDKYLSYEPGCTYDNDWCDAPERSYQNTNPFKCALPDPRGDVSTFVLFGLLLLGLWRRRALAAVLLALSCTWALPTLVQAEDRAKTGSAHTRRQQADGNGNELMLGGYAGASGSVDHGALAFALGGRLRVHKNWIVGLDAEWNPFISDPRVVYNTDHFRPGVFNGYATAIFRIPLSNEDFNLRSTAHLGFSTMVMDLYGAPAGSTGIFAALSPLGLEWKMARVPYLVIQPLGIALPVPQLSGVPFMYAQYRFTIGVELYGRP